MTKKNKASSASRRALAGLALCLIPLPVLATDLTDAFTKGKFLLDARYRFEDVDQTGLPQGAQAHTVRARVGYQTAAVQGLSLLAEMEGVAHLNGAFNDSINGKTKRPLVTDPDGAELNRLQLDYSGLPGTQVTLGRQRINLDNQRFIGAVGFRQNEQTFDALRVVNKSIANVELNYALVTQVNRIFGNESPQGEYEGTSHLLNAAITLAPVGKITGYAYFLDLNEQPLLTTRTVGARLAGKQTLGTVTLAYVGEYAHQTDYKHNPREIALDYLAGELTGSIGGTGLTIGIESLEGDGVRGFATPLATLHKFQGYADAFLTTPANGVVDTYGKLGHDAKLTWGSVTGLSAALWYHDFEAERGGARQGSEWDAELALKFGPKITAGVKYADFDGRGALADRRKIWLSVDYVL